MKRLQKRIEDVLSAVSFAEEGEFSTAREMARGDGRVLLGLSGTAVNRNVLRYALDVSKRTGADLDILCVSGSRQVRAAAREFADEARKQGVDAVIVRAGGNLHDEIVAYSNAHANVLFVVVNSLSSVQGDRAGGALMRSWADLPCPLVVVDGMSNA